MCSITIKSHSDGKGSDSSQMWTGWGDYKITTILRREFDLSFWCLHRYLLVLLLQVQLTMEEIIGTFCLYHTIQAFRNEGWSRQIQRSLCRSAIMSLKIHRCSAMFNQSWDFEVLETLKAYERTHWYSAHTNSSKKNYIIVCISRGLRPIHKC